MDVNYLQPLPGALQRRYLHGRRSLPQAGGALWIALLQKEEHSEDGLTLSGFPYNQMHHYVEKITACYAKYTELYGA